MKVILRKQQRQPPLNDRRLLQKALERAADLTGLAEQFEDQSDADLQVILLDAEAMAELNQNFLGHAGPTDVLAFDLGSDSPALPDERHLIGEVYLCLDVAVKAAQEYRTSLGDECVLYAVHGMLHLRGMDDHDETSRKAMRREEERVMTGLRENVDLRAIFRCRDDESADSERADG